MRIGHIESKYLISNLHLSIRYHRLYPVFLSFCACFYVTVSPASDIEASHASKALVEMTNAQTDPFQEIPNLKYPPDRHVIPDRRLGKMVGRMLAEQYDCPNTNQQAVKRLNRKIFSSKALYDAMTPSERKDCESEGDRRALSRVNTMFESLPQKLLSTWDTGRIYLEKRQVLKDTQCEADLKSMEIARTAYSEARVNARLGDDDFYWDIARVSRGKLLNEVNRKISVGDVVISLLASSDPTGKSTDIRVEATGLPHPDIKDFVWRAGEYEWDDQYRPANIKVTQVQGEIVADDIKLDQLPIINTPINANWVHENEFDVSTKSYGASWPTPEGYRYCKHTLTVFSDNNVCNNYLDISSTGVRVHAEIKSGSIVDKWDGWLRFIGTLTSIKSNATRCQKARAECHFSEFRTQLVSIDSICKAPPGVGFRGICYRKEMPERDVCHVGVLTEDGRCVVDTIVPCY